MKKPEELIESYQYELPDSKIAAFPLAERAEAKLLQYRAGKISDHHFFDLPELLPENSLMVFNNTRVIHARLKFKLDSGAQLEIFCLEPAGQLPAHIALAQKKKSIWNCLIGNNRKWKTGELIQEFVVGIERIELKIERLEKNDDSFTVQFTWKEEMCFAEIIEKIGKLPIPPYLNREAEVEDEKNYQTVYAKEEGSVAAPTAGLHFTEEIFGKLNQRKIHSAFLTLHVGAGTFKPVSSKNISDHVMHEEKLIVDINLVEQILKFKNNSPVIAVGTTSLRTLESLYWLGLQVYREKEFEEYFYVGQWEPYENVSDLPGVEVVLNALLSFARKRKLNKLEGFTGIMITSAYALKVADALITNFHQPASTLLCLVSSILGDDWRKVYEHALNNDYRFLSYGDGNLYWCNELNTH